MFMQQNAADQVDEHAASLGPDQSRLARFDWPSSWPTEWRGHWPGNVVVFGSPEGDDDARGAAFRAFVSAAVPTEQSAYRRRVRSASFVGMLVRLALRPSLIITEGFGPLVVLSCLYRCAFHKATFLVYLAEPPKRSRLKERLILRMADGVLVDGNAAEIMLVGLGHEVHRITPDYGLDRFLEIAATRSPQQARRIVVVSDLTPGSGASDLLGAVTAWSEANAHKMVELNWIGEGDLSGLLAAQPLPDNMSQVFHSSLDVPGIAAIFAEGGMLAVPSIVDGGRGHVAEALAAGLPVVGSRRSREVRQHVTDEVTGWLFDPLTPGNTLDGVTRALGTTDQRLSEMRLQARAAVSTPSFGTRPARVEHRGRAPAMHSAVHDT